MTFLHATLLIGGVLASIPIILHLLGRHQPRPITFPAVRFVRETAVSAQRGWSIKRWLLLILRTLLLLLLAFALASPRVHSSMFGSYLLIGLLAILAVLATAAALTAYGARRPAYVSGVAALVALLLWGGSGSWLYMALANGQSVPIPSASGPICAAVIVDTSPSMGYRYHNMTRLEQAKEMAQWLMDRLPVGSQIAIVGGDAGVRLNQDRMSADRQLERIVVEGRATSLVQRISSAIDMLRRSELERREIYVITDLNTAAWRDIENSDVPSKLARNEDGTGKAGENVLLQIIDVSVPPKEIRNWSISKLKLSQESTVPGGQVTLNAEIQSTPGSGNEQMTVELAIEPVDKRLPIMRDGKMVVPTSKVIDRQLIEVPDGGSVPVQMTLKDLAEGTNHAELRLSRPDPLEIDNSYYMSVDAKTLGQTIVFADNARDGQIVNVLIEPEAYASGTVTDKPENAQQQSANSRFELISKIGNVDLSRFSNIVLYNPSKIAADDADKLMRWVEGGGGLLIVLGPGFDSAQSMMDSPLHMLLPGTVKRLTRRPLDSRTIFLSPRIGNHPIWSIFERPIEEIPWVNYPIFKHWDIESLDNQATAIMRFTDSEQPALIEWTRRQGRILVLTVPYPEPASTQPLQAWSELFTTSADAWPGYALFLGIVRYLASWNQHQVNYLVDAPAVLDNNSAQYPRIYELFSPTSEVVRVESADDLLNYAFTRQPGQYRIRGLRVTGPVVRGFSVNVDRADISLELVDTKALDTALGKDLYLVAREKSDVQSSLGEGRYGRDLTPVLLVIIVMMIMGEQTMSSRFYASSQRRAA